MYSINMELHICSAAGTEGMPMVWGGFHARLHCTMQLPAICMSAQPQEGKGLTQFFSCSFMLQSHQEFSFPRHHWDPNWIQKYSIFRRFANRRVWAVFRFIGLVLLAFSSHLYPESFMLHLLLNCLKTQITHTRVQLVCEHKYFFSLFSQTLNTPAESRQGRGTDRNVLCPAMLRRWAAMEMRLPGKDHSGSPYRATACLQSRIRGNRQASKKAKAFPWRSQ